MSTIKISDDRLNSFYNQNPDFDILQFNLLNGKTNSLNWDNLDREITLDLLKKYQRLLRINPNVEIAKRLLNAPQSPQAEQASAPSSPTTSVEFVPAITASITEEQSVPESSIQS